MTTPAAPPRSPVPPAPGAGAGSVRGQVWPGGDAAAWAATGQALPGRPRRDLSKRMAVLLAEGDREGHFGHGRSAVAMSVALAAVGSGWSRDELRRAFDEVSKVKDTPGDWLVRDPRGRGRLEHDQDHRFERLWRDAVVRWHNRPPASDLQQTTVELAGMREAADARPFLWGGQAGASNRAVLEALWGICVQASRLDPTASIRQIAERTTVTASTVDRVIDRLVAAGWVRVDEPAGVDLFGKEDEHGRRQGRLRARRLHVLLPTSLPPAVDPETLADPDSGELPPTCWSPQSVHDVFTWRGLGRVAGRLYDTLDATPVPSWLLAARVGYTAQTVRRHLRRLASAGLACHSTRGWTRGTAALDAVAAHLGVEGTLAVRAERHAEQRAGALAWFVEFANRRGWRVEKGRYRPDGSPPARVPRLPLPVQRETTRIPLGA